MKNIDVFNKHLKNSYIINKYESISYQGTYELDFLEKYYNIGINKYDAISYLYENKNRIYYPDFYYKPLNLIIEIKSNYYYYKCLYKNLAKQKSCIEQGYNFIFIIDKNYDEFKKLIS